VESPVRFTTKGSPAPGAERNGTPLRAIGSSMSLKKMKLTNAQAKLAARLASGRSIPWTRAAARRDVRP